MKFQVTFKTPDALDNVINIDYNGLSKKEKEEMEKVASQWIEYGEYLTVEIDTEKKTCIVV